MQKVSFKESIPDNFFWLNKPPAFHLDNGLIIKTASSTDFWQKTHYGFIHDNGHMLATNLDFDFTISARFSFEPVNQYDQCGLIIYLNQNSWVKVSTEYESEEISRLGSVVTNSGYSDWATTNISSQIQTIWYRLNRRGQDFLVEYSYNGISWKQMRIFHMLTQFTEIKAGIYACSPLDGSFRCTIDRLVIDQNKWFHKA